MNSRGEIRELTEEQAKAAQTENEARITQGQPVEQVEITEVLARFFRSRSKLFREVWGRKLVRGLSPDQKANLQVMVGDFLKKENAIAQKAIQEMRSEMRRGRIIQTVELKNGSEVHLDKEAPADPIRGIE